MIKRKMRGKAQRVARPAQTQGLLDQSLPNFYQM